MRNQQSKSGNQDETFNSQSSKQNMDKGSDPEHKRTRKPGSQSNSSKQHNNGRGGGK